MNKKGSHIGIMISFTIFIVFLIFLYGILEPSIKTEKDTELILEDLKINLIKELSVEVNITTLKIIDYLGSASCIEIINPNFISSSNLVIKDKLNNELGYEKISALKINSDSNFFKIYEAELFGDRSVYLSSCLELTPINYTLGLTKANKYVSINKISELKQKYENDYGGLKNELNLYAGGEFGFNFILNNKTSIGVEEKDVSTSIYAEEISVQYVDESANILIGTLNIRTWG
ncbi:MAG: hypothetical protein KKF48_03485 [Nanoarchaeota archaeon]|nr:hypothetical protein [Nanoarchaeota archaeon]MBU1028082.1 hypothetical protein [Nanoarchaeota archaeon]